MSRFWSSPNFKLQPRQIRFNFGHKLCTSHSLNSKNWNTVLCRVHGTAYSTNQGIWQITTFIEHTYHIKSTLLFTSQFLSQSKSQSRSFKMNYTTSNNTATKRTSRMMSVRRRGEGSRSKANARWNLIESDDKCSYKLRRMLQKEDISSSISLQSTNQQLRSPPSRTNSLHDEFSKDIKNLLKSLQSIEFVGTIDPQYHSRYVIEESFQ